MSLNSPMKPWFGVAMSGGAISRVIPQTRVVLPRRMRAEEGAVEMEPAPAREGEAKVSHWTDDGGVGCSRAARG